MGHPRTAARGLVMLGALALVAGCIPTLADDDPTGDPSTAKVGAGQLTEEQIASVLPGEDEIPEGFSPETDEGAPSDPEATAYPATCLDVRLAGTAGKELGTHRTARRTADFVGSEGGYLSVTVSSHDQPVPAQLFELLGGRDVEAVDVEDARAASGLDDDRARHEGDEGRDDRHVELRPGAQLDGDDRPALRGARAEGGGGDLDGGLHEVDEEARDELDERPRVDPAEVLDRRQREDLGDDGADDQPVDDVAEGDPVPQQNPDDGEGDDRAGLPAAAPGGSGRARVGVLHGPSCGRTALT